MIFEIFLLSIIFGIITFLIILFLIYLISSIYSSHSGSPYVSNDKAVINKILEQVEISPNDVFVDLGSGDGRVLFKVLQKKPSEIIGYEIAPFPYILSQIKKQIIYKDNRIKIYRRDIFQADFSKATIIYAYLLPKLLEKLEPTLIENKKKNSNIRIITPVFKLENIPIKSKIKVYHPKFGKKIEVYFY